MMLKWCQVRSYAHSLPSTGLCLGVSSASSSLAQPGLGVNPALPRKALRKRTHSQSTTSSHPDRSMGFSLAECAEVSLSAPSPCEVSREATAPPLSVCSGELITVCRLNEARGESSQNVPAQAAFSVTPTGDVQPFRYPVSHGLSSYKAPHSGGRDSICKGSFSLCTRLPLAPCWV